jgi:hypothetical protein
MAHDIDTFELLEGTTPDYEATLLDKSEVAIPGSVLDSLTLTFFQEYTETIINSRDGQNVLQVNGVTVDEAGRMVWTLTPEDSAILDDSLHQEPHLARFDFTYPGASGTEVGRHVVRLLVTNLRRVP